MTCQGQRRLPAAAATAALSPAGPSRTVRRCPGSLTWHWREGQLCLLQALYPSSTLLLLLLLLMAMLLPCLLLLLLVLLLALLLMPVAEA